MSQKYNPSASENSLVWRRSSKCTVGSCVEVATTPTRVLVRDSKQVDAQNQPIIGLGADDWSKLASALAFNYSEIDLSGVRIRSSPDGAVTLTDVEHDTMLQFDQHEWSAFTAALADGEFS